MKIPFELSHLICDCVPDEVYQNHKKYYKGVGKHDKFKCVKCDKYRRCFTALCVECKSLFVNTFSHPFKCGRQGRCWGCLEQLDSRPCSHDACIRFVSLPRNVPDPEMLSKRKKVTTFNMVMPTLKE